MDHEFEHDGETYLAEPDGGHVSNGTPLDQYAILKEVRSVTGEVTYERASSATVERRHKPSKNPSAFFKALRDSAFPDREEDDKMDAMNSRRESSMTKPEEWQIVNSVSDAGTRREYVAHLLTPRFNARIVQIEPFEGRPIKAEGGADFSGLCLRMRGRNVICEIDWTDVIPACEDEDAFARRWVGEAVNAWHRLKTNFLFWKDLSSVREMAEKVQLDIDHCQTWNDYTQAFCAENNRSHGGLVRRVRELADVISSGEVPVLLGMLHAADFSRIADEIGGEEIWRRFDLTHGEHAQAAGLAIMRN